MYIVPEPPVTLAWTMPFSAPQVGACMTSICAMKPACLLIVIAATSLQPVWGICHRNEILPRC